MSSPFFERPTTEHRIGDHHDRIRALEALVSTGGSDPTICPDCVLDPFTVNLDDIFVPEIYRACVDIAAHSQAQPVDQCGTGNVTIVSSMGIGNCSGYALGTALGVQLRAVVLFAPCNISVYGPTANMANLILYAGNPESQVTSFGWDVAGTPGQSPCSFDTGWVTIPELCGGSCAALTASMTFQSHSSFTGGCAQGSLFSRWVPLEEGGEFIGALGDLPQAEDGDVVHFSSLTHDWTTGPARRRTALFMG